MAVARKSRAQVAEFLLSVWCPNVVCPRSPDEVHILAPLDEIYLCSSCGTHLSVGPR